MPTIQNHYLQKCWHDITTHYYVLQDIFYKSFDIKITYHKVGVFTRIKTIIKFQLPHI